MASCNTTKGSPDGSGWDDAFEEEIEEVQILSQEADELHSETSAVSSDPTTDSPVSCWWASVLQAASMNLGHDRLKWNPAPVTVVSACTGCSAESSVLKAPSEHQRMVGQCFISWFLGILGAFYVSFSGVTWMPVTNHVLISFVNLDLLAKHQIYWCYSIRLLESGQSSFKKISP